MFNSRYHLAVRSPMGSMKQDVVFETDAEGNVGGYVEAGKDIMPFEKVEIDGNKFRVEMKLKTPIGTKDSFVEGEIEGTHITGRVKTPFGMAKFQGDKA